MTINLSLRSCFGIRASNEAPAPNQSSPRLSGFCQAVKHLCKKLFQCTSASASASANATVNQDPLMREALDLILRRLLGHLKPNSRERLVVALAMTKTWGNQSDPIMQLARASSPKDLPDPQKLLSSLGLQSAEGDPQALKTLCGIIQKKLYPMIDQVLNGRSNSTSAAQLGTWLCKVFAKEKLAHSMTWLNHLVKPMQEEVLRLLDSTTPHLDVNTPQYAVQAQIKRILSNNKTFNDMCAKNGWDKPFMGKGAFALPLLRLNEQQKIDPEFAMVTVSNRWANYLLYNHFSPEIWANREVVLLAVKNNGSALQFAHDDLKKDQDVVMHACLEQNGAFKYASDELKQDRSFVLKLVSQAGKSLKHAAPELQKDVEILAAAATHTSKALNADHHTNSVKADKFPYWMYKNKNAMLAIVSRDGFMLSKAEFEPLSDDRDVVMAAVKQNGNALAYASNRLKADREVVKTAYLQNPDSLVHANEGYKNYPAFIREVFMESLKYKNTLST